MNVKNDVIQKCRHTKNLVGIIHLFLLCMLLLKSNILEKSDSISQLRQRDIK